MESFMKGEIVKIKKEQIKTDVQAASRDPLFLSDIEAVEKDFEDFDFEEGFVIIR